MALTPADVHNQQFTTVRMRTGYDMDEVDSFLDVVESEITRLLAENDDLRAQVTQAQSRALAAEQRASAAQAPSEPPRQTEPSVEPSDEPSVDVVADAVADVVADVVEEADVVDEADVREVAAVVDEAVVVEDAEATGALEPVSPPVALAATTPPSEQALKILEIAQRTADETVAHAQSEAHSIVTQARSEAAEVTADLDAKRVALEEQVGRLRTFERNYRVALRDHIAGQLAQFDRAASQEESVAGPAPAIEAVQTLLDAGE